MNQESDKDSTVTRGHYIQNILKNANLWYTKTKNKYPRLESGIDRFYPAIQPISTIITGYGEPIIDRIDSTVDSVIKRGQAALKKESLTFKEQKEFYKAIVKTWMQDHESFESFNSLMKRNYSYVWSQKIDAQTVWFWTRSLAYNKPVEVLNLVTDILSDGCDSLCRGLVYTWNSLKNYDYPSFKVKLKATMGNNWSSNIAHKAEIFYSVSKLRSKLSDKWLKKAKQTASSTSIILLASADDLYFWTNEVFNNYSVADIYRIPRDRFSRALLSASKTQNNMASYIGNKLGSEIKYISQTRFYKQVERTMNLNEKLENLNNYAVSLKNVNKEQILSKKWPENIKEMFDSTIQSVGGKSFVIYLQDKVWKRLDIDQDGVITVRDLVEFGSPKTFIEWTKQTLGNIRIPFIVNGESGKAEIN